MAIINAGPSHQRFVAKRYEVRVTVKVGPKWQALINPSSSFIT